jgi:hypothetical protein
MSRYDRQPTEILIEVKARGQTTHDKHNTVNLSTGGLAFRCERKFEPGEIVGIRVPFVSPPFEAEARVAWCKAHENRYEIGVEFLNQDDAYMARMVEQVCLIENYKKEAYQAEGRTLSPEEAAVEWINKYASQFPDSSGTK